MAEVSRSTRAARNRHNRHESLREELKSREYLRQVHALLGTDWIQPALTKSGKERRVKGRPLMVDRSREFEGKAKIYLNLLRKTLPDLKPTDQAVSLPGWQVTDTTTDQSRALMSAVVAGTLTPEQGWRLLSAIAAQGQIEKLHDLEQRLQSLEQEPKKYGG